MPGVIVLGAGPGIGISVARRFAREGLPVGVIARSAGTVDAATAALDGSEVLGLRADVTDESALRKALDDVIERFGVPDSLVYNTGLIQADAPGDLSTEGHLAAWAVNVVGAITAASHVGPRLAEVGRGSILITGGMPKAVPGYTSLSLGKAGVRALTELLADLYGPAGVHVATVTVAGTVAPGTAYDPDVIAEEYWRLHTQPAVEWEREVLFTG